MPIEFPPENGVRFIKNVTVPVSDGVHLAMDLHVPDSEDWQNTPLPLILGYDPYRKDDAAPYSGYHDRFARHGFIGARLDCRGTGASEGTNTDEYTPQEQQDGVEGHRVDRAPALVHGEDRHIRCLLRWIHGGADRGTRASPHLTTIVPIFFTDDRYTDDCHYRGGCSRCYYDIGTYGTSMIGRNAMRPYPEYAGDRWAEV